MCMCVSMCARARACVCVSVTVCVGDQPQNWMQHQTVWFVQALDDSILEGAVKSGNINLFLIGIITGPEQVSGHPVHCQAVSVGQI